MARIHPTALIEHGVKLGAKTTVSDGVRIRHGAVIGDQCSIGEKSYIAGDVRIGRCVRIEPMVFLSGAITIEDGVLISASTTFTNDQFPRATFPDLKTPRHPGRDEFSSPTIVRAGATIGAGCVIGNDLEIGRWAMIGMGSVVTTSVPDFHLVMGSAARSIGAACKCGVLFHRFADGIDGLVECSCGLAYYITAGLVTEADAIARKRPASTKKQLSMAYA